MEQHLLILIMTITVVTGLLVAEMQKRRNEKSGSVKSESVLVIVLKVIVLDCYLKKEMDKLN